MKVIHKQSDQEIATEQAIERGFDPDTIEGALQIGRNLAAINEQVSRASAHGDGKGAFAAPLSTVDSGTTRRVRNKGGADWGPRDVQQRRTRFVGSDDVIGDASDVEEPNPAYQEEIGVLKDNIPAAYGTPLPSEHGGEYLSDDEIYEEETEDKANTRWDTHLSPNDRPSLTRMFVNLLKAMPLEGAMTSVMQRALRDGWDLARAQGLEDLVNKPTFWTGFEKLMKEPMEFYARRAIVRAASRHKQLGVKPTDIADIADKAAKKFTRQWYSHIRNATAGKMYDLKDVKEPELSQRAFTLFNRDRAERIAANEASKLNDIGNLLVYQVAGIDEEFWSTEKDAKVDDICKRLSGRRFKMGEGPRPITDTHLGCRCERLPILQVSKAVQQEAVGPNAGKGEVIFGEDPDPEMAAHDMAGKGANDWIKTIHKQGPPGPPPRPGLEWHAETSRWRRRQIEHPSFGGEMVIHRSPTTANHTYNELLKETGDTITHDEQAALNTYSGSLFEEINDELRSGGKPEDVAILDAAVSKRELPEPMLVFRGGMDLEDMVNGEVISDPGFTSTSLLAQTAREFGTSIQILLPKGTKFGLGHPNEYELILPRNAKFKVKQISGVTVLEHVSANTKVDKDYYQEDEMIDELDDQEEIDKHTTASNVNSGHAYERMRVINRVSEGISHQAEGGRERPFGHDDGNPPMEKEGDGGRGIAGPGDSMVGSDVHTPVGGSARRIQRKNEKTSPRELRIVKAVEAPAQYDMQVLSKQYTGKARENRFVVAGYASPVMIDLEGHRIGHKTLADDLPRFLAEDGRYANVNIMHCLVPETGVLIKRGGPGEYKTFKRIDEIEEGDSVYTHKGRKQTVNKVAKFWKNEELIKLRLSNGVTIQITKDHKVLTTAGWIEAGQLTVQHVLMHARPRGPQSTETKEKIRKAHVGRKHWWKPGPNKVTSGEAARITAEQRRGKTWAEVYGEEKAAAKSEKHKQWRGEKHPNWRGGRSGGEYNWSFYKTRREILKRDGHACVRCGITNGEVLQNNNYHSGLHVDHINNVKSDDRLENLQALCPSCHSKKTRSDDKLIREMVLANGVKILDVQRVLYKGWTYCLNIDEDHSYVGNGIVYHNTNVTVGKILPEFTAPDGKIYKTKVDDVGLFVIAEVRTDEAAPEVCKQVIDDIESGKLKSFSISGNASNPQWICEGDKCFFDIGQLQLLEITLCEEGVNQDAKFDIIAKALKAGTYFGLPLIQRKQSRVRTTR
ncbi:hypothetical protein LCGC14_0264160 [marine sediment metagenome]|uniref:Uncharacterized protein n=1 Tax=marine sediment metagenome TaxID=412755 RepID=A0A0F9UHP5_9ZZZZ